MRSDKYVHFLAVCRRTGSRGSAKPVAVRSLLLLPIVLVVNSVPVVVKVKSFQDFSIASDRLIRSNPENVRPLF